MLSNPGWTAPCSQRAITDRGVPALRDSSSCVSPARRRASLIRSAPLIRMIVRERATAQKRHNHKFDMGATTHIRYRNRERVARDELAVRGGPLAAVSRERHEIWLAGAARAVLDEPSSGPPRAAPD